MTKEQAVILLQRYREGLCSGEEKEAIERWYALLEAKGEWEWTDSERALFGEELFEQISAEVTGDRKDKTIKMSKRFTWWKAAAAVFLMGAATYMWVLLTGDNETGGPVEHVAVVKDVNDAEPGKAGAILTLANGQKILLDTAANGTISLQGGPTILNTNGTLRYDDDNNSSGIVAYNSIVTPKGRQYRLVLSDGTKVWLNAASSLYYPVDFTGGTRKVEVSGEAYFEVAERKDIRGKKTPFIVRINHESGNPAEVQVLGTHFNVNAYDDEPDTKITLLEGAVKVSSETLAPVLMQPGQQVKISDKIAIEKSVDLDMVVAWKNGTFNFKNADVSAVMRQAERWYDIRVEYPQGIPRDTLNGGISRDVKLSEFLDIIRYSDIRATIGNGVVEIKPAVTGKK
ncbi:FecR domain-containing protein [Agriterribacter sp.]|uniref:FecR family protein n=1 Tax=Agriterribacter sp. TaxID=2821509 RepID=UPI002C0423A0|nr:FecR domain-containing protein [Agriterribacter sp.]HRP55174.1 FecR domain-containing protein [Agriterribacter sp.]